MYVFNTNTYYYTYYICKKIYFISIFLKYTSYISFKKYYISIYTNYIGVNKYFISIT